MANAKQLPSGAWRTQITKTIDGKKVKKSFTVHPNECEGNSKKAKLKSEYLAREWSLTEESNIVHGMTVEQACERYINDRNKVLSPCTVREYQNTVKHFAPISTLSVSDIDTPKLQRLINDMSMDVGAKTIKNRISFLLSVLDYAGIDKKFKVRYPQRNSKKVVSPDIEDVQMYIRAATDFMVPIIHLAAFGSLRRGEICGLREKDISRDMNMITVAGDKILGPNGWEYKPFPKTEDSARTVQLPKFIIDMIPKKEDPEAFVFDIVPATITDRFAALSEQLGLPYTFHSLRHFSASFRTDLGIPKKYIQEIGGWVDNSTVLDRVYDNTIGSSRKKYTQITNKFIEENFHFKEAAN